MKKYDVIIAGASFAGLAVASKIDGKVLLLDKNDIGMFQRSACGTVVKTVKENKCEKAILQRFDTAALHTKNKEYDFSLCEPYCTINYERFCKLFYKQCSANFFKANVHGVEKSADKLTIKTNKGNFKAKIIVDCTGWEAVLASSLQKNYVNKNMASFGLETEIPYKDNKLRFFIDPGIIENGAAWLFPCGKTARFGLGSYAGDTNILKNLKRFVKSYNLKIGKLHGGCFCYCLKQPVVKNIFVVGCAAGQTLPLTGEGIRRSINFGKVCGEIIQEILDNKITLKQGLKKYKDTALKNEKHYSMLLNMQNKLPRLKNWQTNLYLRILSFKPITDFMLRKYLFI